MLFGRATNFPGLGDEEDEATEDTLGLLGLTG
jgi:hypothetical protein